MKKTSDAEAALLRRIKNEIEMRSTKEEITDTILKWKILENEESELASRRESVKLVKSNQDRIRKEVIALTGVNKFAMPRNKKQIIATLKDVRFTSFALHRLNEGIHERETESRKRLDYLLENFNRLNSCETVTKEKLLLLLPPRAKNKRKQRDVLEHRRNKLIQEIQSIKENFNKKILLDEVRKKTSPESHASGETLADYLDGNIETVKKEIYKSNSQVKNFDIELKNLTNLVEEKKEEIANTKRTIKDISKTNVNSSKEYGKIISQNVQLQEKLNGHVSHQYKLNDEAKKLMAFVEEQRRNKKEDSKMVTEIQQCVSELKRKIDDKRSLEADKDEIHEGLMEETEKCESQTRSVSSETFRLEKECENELKRLDELKNKSSLVEDENKTFLTLISRMSQETLEKLWYH